MKPQLTADGVGMIVANAPSQPLNLTATVEIQAGAAGDTPKVSILAYTGGLMTVPGFGPVVIDAAGLQIGESTTLLADHAAGLDGIVGAGRAGVRDGQVFVDGVLASASVAAKKIIDLHKSGVRFQASVGVEPLARTTTKAVKANGRDITSNTPFTYVSSGRLREISITAIGADPGTTVAIAAMAEGAAAPAGDAPRDIYASLLTLAAKYPSVQPAKFDAIQAAALSEQWPDSRIELELLRAARPSGMMNVRVSAAGGRTDSPDTVIAAALMLHAGRGTLAEKSFGAPNAQLAADLRCHTLLDICASALRLEMRDVPRDRSEMIRAAFSTYSLPTALGSYADKMSADAFRETPGVWQTICRRRPVNNFREQKILRVLLVGEYQDLPNGGEIKHGSLSEGSKAVQAGTKGLMLGITRQDIINDDLGVFNDTANALGRAGARSMNDAFANTLLANTGSFFSSDNANYLEGATAGTNDTRLNAEGLTRGMQAMAKQEDAEGRSVDVRAKYLLVPPELEFTAMQLLKSAELQRYVASGVDNQPMGNPHQAAAELLVEPRLSNSSYSGYSALAWYLFAQPTDGAVNVALLNGKETPTVEQADAPFNMLGVLYRGYIDFGFALGEPIAAFKAKGAA